MRITHHNHPRNGQLLLALLITPAVALYCVGCKSTTAEWEGVKLTDRRFFLRTEADIKAKLPNGLEVEIKAKSDPQTEAFKAIAEGAAAGASRFVKP